MGQEQTIAKPVEETSRSNSSIAAESENINNQNQSVPKVPNGALNLNMLIGKKQQMINSPMNQPKKYPSLNF